MKRLASNFSYNIGVNFATLKNEARDLYGQPILMAGRQNSCNVLELVIHSSLSLDTKLSVFIRILPRSKQIQLQWR